MTDERKPRTLKEYLDDMKRSVNRLLEISSAGEAAFLTNEDKQDAAIISGTFRYLAKFPLNS